MRDNSDVFFGTTTSFPNSFRTFAPSESFLSNASTFGNSSSFWAFQGHDQYHDIHNGPSEHSFKDRFSSSNISITTTETRSSGADLDGSTSSCGEPPSNGKNSAWLTKLAEHGEGLPFGVAESADPRVSETTADKTEVGDWFSGSESEE